MHVDDGKCLRIESRPPFLSFAAQSARINTLVLVPPGLANISLNLKAGELWVFGDMHNVAADCVSASVVAGAVAIVDTIASRIDARNCLGDVTVHWDCDGPSSHNIQVDATTMLGDTNVTTSGTTQSGDPSTIRRTAHSLVDWRGTWLSGTGRSFFHDTMSPVTTRK